jgi:hypothetical protein
MSTTQSAAAELKQQGAVEAAQDGAIQPEDAEKKIVEESKKGGATAYQFDPNATPAEKAAQAKAVSHCEIPTDVD